MSDQLLARIFRAVRARANRRTGVLLSGGLDSSTIAALAPELPRFTGYYTGMRYDERRYARLAVGTAAWHQIHIVPSDFPAHFDEMIAAVPAPYQGPGMFGQWMVAREAGRHVDVLLSGEGGDELFGGYARLLRVAGEPLPEGYDQTYQQPDGYPDTLEDALEWDWNRLAALAKCDEQIGAAHGVSVDAPMLDPEVSDWVRGLDPQLRIGKRLLRAAVRGIVHDDIRRRRDKMGFPVPYVAWAQEDPVRSFVRDRIGYVPDPAKPWDRQWWNDLCYTTRALQKVPA